MNQSFDPQQDIKVTKVNWKELFFKLITQHKRKDNFKKLLEDMTEEEKQIITENYERWLRR